MIRVMRSKYSWIGLAVSGAVIALAVHRMQIIPCLLYGQFVLDELPIDQIYHVLIEVDCAADMNQTVSVSMRSTNGAAIGPYLLYVAGGALHNERFNVVGANSGPIVGIVEVSRPHELRFLFDRSDGRVSALIGRNDDLLREFVIQIGDVDYDFARY